MAILWSHSKLGNYNGEKKVEKIAGNIVECEVKCSFVLRRFAKASLLAEVSHDEEAKATPT